MSTSIEMHFDENSQLPDYIEEPIPTYVAPSSQQIADKIYEMMADLYEADTEDDFIHTFIRTAHYIIRYDDAHIFLWDNTHIATILLSFASYILPRAPTLLGLIDQLQTLLLDILAL